jgi:hypothetical protein
VAEPGILTAQTMANTAGNTTVNVNVTGPTTADIMKAAAITNPEIAETIQMLEALRGLDTKLEEAWQAWKRGDVDGMRQAVLASNFYKNNNAIARQRKQAEISQPGVYLDSLNKYKLATRKNLVASGLKMDAKLFEGLAKTAYDSGMDENQLKNLIVSSNLVTGYGGAIIGETDSLKAYANSFGVTKYLNDQYWAQKSQDLFLGNATVDDIQNEIKNIAASAFPMYADPIRNGVTVQSIASSYIGAKASILEKDPNSITIEDPDVRAALQAIGPDGKPVIKPLWQFEREMRMRPEWELTNNARTTIDNLTYKAFSDMGLI